MGNWAWRRDQPLNFHSEGGITFGACLRSGSLVSYANLDADCESNRLDQWHVITDSIRQAFYVIASIYFYHGTSPELLKIYKSYALVYTMYKYVLGVDKSIIFANRRGGKICIDPPSYFLSAVFLI
jgi:hypothetical protein